VGVDRHWTLDEATAALPEVRVIVRRLRELVTATRTTPTRPGEVKPSSNGHGNTTEKRTRELREHVEELTGRGIVVRDPERGLIDFPALSPTGRTYLLCWLDDEDEISWWHWPDAGFAGRTPLTEPPE
jgi:hypothetical protein